MGKRLAHRSFTSAIAGNWTYFSWCLEMPWEKYPGSACCKHSEYLSSTGGVKESTSTLESVHFGDELGFKDIFDKHQARWSCPRVSSTICVEFSTMKIKQSKNIYIFKSCSICDMKQLISVSNSLGSGSLDSLQTQLALHSPAFPLRPPDGQKHHTTDISKYRLLYADT